MPPEVIVVPHDPSWLEMFEAESQLIGAALGSNAQEVHHIGSTAIPGIVAKPIIDLLVVVGDIKAVDDSNPAMAQLGYQVMGEYGIPGRRYFRKNDAAGNRTHHFHVFQIESDEIRRHLVFRDYLRAHPDWAQNYSQLKVLLAQEHANSSAAYVEGKSNFVRQIDKLAAIWFHSISR